MRSAVIYLSVIDTRMAERFIAQQERACRAAIKEWGLAVKAVHTDKGLTIRRGRPGLSAAMADLKKGDTLVTADFSRLAGSKEEGASLLQYIGSRGAKYRCAAY